MNPNLQNLDQDLARFLTQMAPMGSGPEARAAVLCALADVLGMYLAGNYAKEGPRAYRKTFEELIDRTHGVATAQAAQLRSAMGLTGAQQTLGVVDRGGQPVPTMAEVEARDPTGEALVLLSSLGALIHVEEPEYWRLPGYPPARARVIEGGAVEMVVDGTFDEQPSTTWIATRQVKTDA